MIDNKKVSIILPAYNVEIYIKQCIDSIIHQTYKNIEIIIVDDGSSDNTYLLAYECAVSDDRIILIQQQNAGAGSARNAGIKVATGEYIMFVDPDDWIDPDMVKDYIFISIKNNVDMVISGYYEYYITDNKTTITDKCFSQQHLTNQLDVRKNYIKLFLKEAICAPTRILYKKSIIDDYNIQFPDLRRSQDIVFNYRYYDYVHSIYITEKIYYHYRIETNSHLLKLKHNYYQTICLIYRDIIDLHKRWNVNITEKDYLSLNNRFMVLIGYYIESCILQKCIFSNIFNETLFIKIANNSKPLDLYHKIIKKYFLKKEKILIYLIVSIKIFIKQRCKLLFKILRKIKKY